MNIPPKYEDLVVQLDAALERNAVLQAELEEKQAFAEMFYSKQVLAETKMRNAEGREAALREELARYQSLFAQAQKAIDRLNELHPKRMGELAKRLTVAEQRLGDAYEWGYGDGQNSPNGYSDKEDRDKCVAELLKPATEGDSDLQKIGFVRMNTKTDQPRISMDDMKARYEAKP